MELWSTILRSWVRAGTWFPCSFGVVYRYARDNYVCGVIISQTRRQLLIYLHGNMYSIMHSSRYHLIYWCLLSEAECSQSTPTGVLMLHAYLMPHLDTSQSHWDMTRLRVCCRCDVENSSFEDMKKMPYPETEPHHYLVYVDDICLVCHCQYDRQLPRFSIRTGDHWNPSDHLSSFLRTLKSCSRHVSVIRCDFIRACTLCDITKFSDVTQYLIMRRN